MVLLDLRVKNTNSRAPLQVTSDHLTKIPIYEGEPTEADDEKNFRDFGERLGEPAVGKNGERAKSMGSVRCSLSY